MKFKLDENLPVSAAAILTSAGHDVDTVAAEGLTGAPDPDVVVAATGAGRILISLDVGLGDIRADGLEPGYQHALGRGERRPARSPRPCHLPA
jgi:predicted nuclease of predicted toxin-antitoxin system